MIDIQTVLNRIRPGAQWALNGDSYDGLEWLDDSPKPTAKEIEKALPVVAAQIADEELAAEQEVQKREQQRISAMAKLAKLGLTVDEVQAIIG
jgi:hypothetical protein